MEALSQLSEARGGGRASRDWRSTMLSDGEALLAVFALVESRLPLFKAERLTRCGAASCELIGQWEDESVVAHVVWSRTAAEFELVEPILRDLHLTTNLLRFLHIERDRVSSVLGFAVWDQGWRGPGACIVATVSRFQKMTCVQRLGTLCENAVIDWVLQLGWMCTQWESAGISHSALSLSNLECDLEVTGRARAKVLGWHAARWHRDPSAARAPMSARFDKGCLHRALTQLARAVPTRASVLWQGLSMTCFSANDVYQRFDAKETTTKATRRPWRRSRARAVAVEKTRPSSKPIVDVEQEYFCADPIRCTRSDCRFLHGAQDRSQVRQWASTGYAPPSLISPCRAWMVRARCKVGTACRDWHGVLFFRRMDANLRRWWADSVRPALSASLCPAAEDQKSAALTLCTGCAATIAKSVLDQTSRAAGRTRQKPSSGCPWPEHGGFHGAYCKSLARATFRRRVKETGEDDPDLVLCRAFISGVACSPTCTSFHMNVDLAQLRRDEWRDFVGAIQWQKN